MTDLELKIKDGMVVGLDYTLRLDDGEVIDSSDDGERMEFLQGEGEIITGLEQALYGMAVGDEKSVVIEPADGYGEQDPDAFQVVPRSTFPPDLELTQGQQLRLRDQSGEVFSVFVVEVRPDGVLVDFNHPLAGETLYFDVKISSLRPATNEEMSHGHAHGAD
jgi:FKBP-type peptidyl-prolyl cis-trans isomerase SlyD